MEQVVVFCVAIRTLAHVRGSRYLTSAPIGLGPFVVHELACGTYLVAGGLRRRWRPTGGASAARSQHCRGWKDPKSPPYLRWR